VFDIAEQPLDRHRETARYYFRPLKQPCDLIAEGWQRSRAAIFAASPSK
jgi:hypothetical protein